MSSNQHDRVSEPGVLNAERPDLPLRAVELRAEEIDSATLTRACEGDAEAFRQLVERYQEMVIAVAFTLTGDRQDAEDVAQEAFLRIYRSLEKFRGEAAFSTWIFRVVVNAAQDHRRRRRRSAAVAPGADVELAIGSREATAEQRESAHEVVAAMAALRPALRGPLVLREVYGLEYSEIADLLGRPVGTVKAAVHRGRRALLGELRERGQYEGP